ncbi:MAG TPA: peptidylprolyl isomerase [Ilumatobacteraceae bacterium]|nr:peptidylprolyl isomerase [Ilumatobacteraceae bacterium]
MGTPKRERQKANRQQRLEELARQARAGKRKRTGMFLLLIPLAAIAITGVAVLTKGNGGSTAATTTTVTLAPSTTITTTPLPSTIPGATLTGDTPCPAADGSSPRTITFAKAPPTCIDPTKTYTAAITTNMGAYSVALDATTSPITVNNFVVLARYHYFDSTICHRAIPGFMVQCGDPSGSGQGGPGYTITDELPPDGSYKIGSLAMANSGSANTGGSQFFVVTGDQGVSLGATFSLLGQVTDGLDTTLKTLDAAGNPDQAANGIPPLQQIIIQSVVITET